MKRAGFVVLAVLGLSVGYLSAAPVSWLSGGMGGRVAQAQSPSNACSCPAADCEGGYIAGCSVACQSPEVATCSCQAACNSHTGGASGENSCTCQ